MREFAVRYQEDDDDMLIVDLSGPIDLAAYEPLRVELVAHLAGDARDIVIDLDEVDYLDSTGLRLLVEVAALASRNRRRCVVALSDENPCQTMFSISDVGEILDLAPSAAAARELLRAKRA